MSYTDEQIIQSLPPALQGELKEFGTPETKTSAQIREFLLEKRKAYNLPPWHAFTLLMKRAARRTGESHKHSSSTRWYIGTYGTDVTSDDVYTLDTANEPPWCTLTVHVVNRRGVEGRSDLAVQPGTKRVWALATEYQYSSKNVSCGLADCKTYINLDKDRIIKGAAKLLHAKQTTGVFEYLIKHRKTIAEAKKQESRVEEHVEAPLPASVQPVSVSVPLSVTERQKEVIRTILDLAAVKARELGMHSTIVRWRHTLNDLIGEEEKDVQEQT